MGGWALSCCRTSVPTVSRQTLGNANKRRRAENQFPAGVCIAARTILIGLLYCNAGLESPFLLWMKRSEKFFQLFFSPAFSILLQSLHTRRKWTPRTLVPIQNCFQILDFSATILTRQINYSFIRQASSIQLFCNVREHL